MVNPGEQAWASGQGCWGLMLCTAQAFLNFCMELQGWLEPSWKEKQSPMEIAGDHLKLGGHVGPHSTCHLINKTVYYLLSTDCMVG